MPTNSNQNTTTTNTKFSASYTAQESSGVTLLCAHRDIHIQKSSVVGSAATTPYCQNLPALDMERAA